MGKHIKITEDLLPALSFEKQFAHREFLTMPFGASIETVDMTPEKLKTPIPVLFAGGFRETPELQKECLREVYENQRRVITLLHAPIAYKVDELHDFPAIEVQRARTLLTVLEQKGIKQADFISHSEGSINLAIAATIDPSRFRNLILVTPAGLTGKDSLLRISFGFAHHMIQAGAAHATHVSNGLKKRQRQKDVTLPKSIHAMLQQGRAIASFDIHTMLFELRKKYTIKIAILAGERDTVFPLPKMKSHLSELVTYTKDLTQQEKQNFGFDIFATKPGGHELYVNSHVIMQQVLQLLAELERK